MFLPPDFLLPWGPLELPVVVRRVTKSLSWSQTLSASHNAPQPESPSRHLLPSSSPSSHGSGFQKVSQRGATLLFSMASSRLPCLPMLHLFISSLLQRPSFFSLAPHATAGRVPSFPGWLPYTPDSRDHRVKCPDFLSCTSETSSLQVSGG